LALALLFASVAAGRSAQVDCSSWPLPPDDPPRFFPAGVFGSGPAGAWAERFYPCNLRVFDERPLAEYVSASWPQAYRLIVFPHLRVPLVVRLSVSADGTSELAAKEQGGWKDPKALAIDRSQIVQRSATERFLRLVDEANFWSLPTNQFDAQIKQPRSASSRGRRMKSGPGLEGGVEWVLEGMRAGSYHVASRKSGLNGGARSDLRPYLELTSYLFRDLAHLEIPELR